MGIASLKMNINYGATVPKLKLVNNHVKKDSKHTSKGIIIINKKS